MPRPHEPFADALRTAREIAGTEADALVRAAAQPDGDAYAEARQALILRIAQAIIDAEETARRAMAA